jgi:serine protease
MRSALRALAIHLGAALCLLGLGGAAIAQSASPAAPTPRMALGLIVKLKEVGADGKVRTPSVVRLVPNAVPGESTSALRQRMWAVAHRHGVDYLVHKPTVFAAQLVHAGHPIPIEEARAQAQSLKNDPEVEWAVPNEIMPPASTGVTVSDPMEYAGQGWVAARSTFNTGVGNIEPAWNKLAGRTLTPVAVAVLDSGIRAAPDLSGRVLPGYDFVSEVEYSRDGNGPDSDPSCLARSARFTTAAGTGWRSPTCWVLRRTRTCSAAWASWRRCQALSSCRCAYRASAGPPRATSWKACFGQPV